MTAFAARPRAGPLAYVAFVFSFGVVACSSDEPVNPVQGCHDFVDAWCNKVAECSVPTDHARAREDCQFVIGLDVDCTQVRQLGASYDTCLGRVASLPCPPENVALALPVPCQGVLLK